MSSKPENLAELRLVASDVDGTLTDGGMYYSTTGETQKRFDVKDGLGVKLLQAAGIEVVFISSDDSIVISRRAERLGVRHCGLGVKDKVSALSTICEKVGAGISQAAFLGDDLQDIEVMQAVGYAAAVGDAHELVKAVAQFQCESLGGHGAFREFAEMIIKARGIGVLDLSKGSRSG